MHVVLIYTLPFYVHFISVAHIVAKDVCHPESHVITQMPDCFSYMVKSKTSRFGQFKVSFLFVKPSCDNVV